MNDIKQQTEELTGPKITSDTHPDVCQNLVDVLNWTAENRGDKVHFEKRGYSTPVVMGTLKKLTTDGGETIDISKITESEKTTLLKILNDPDAGPIFQKFLDTHATAFTKNQVVDGKISITGALYDPKTPKLSLEPLRSALESRGTVQLTDEKRGFEATKNTPDATLLSFRTHFPEVIANTDKPLAEIIAIGEDMIKSGEFMMGQKAGHRVSTFQFANIYTSFASSDDAMPSQLKSTSEDLTFDYKHDQQKLAPRTRTLVKLRAIKSNDTNERKEPIRTYAKQMEEAGIPFDHEGKYATCIQALQIAKGLSEKDTIVLSSYLMGNYGGYRTGQYRNNSRDAVFLSDDFCCWFQACDDGDFNCSLLFAVDGNP